MSDQAIELHDEGAVVQIGGVRLYKLELLERWARMLSASQLTPKGIAGPQAVAYAVQCGLELGLGPIQSLQNIAIINGRPVIWGDLALALVKSHPAFVDHIEPQPVNGVATVTSKRLNCNDVVRTYSIEDAKRAGLWGKQGPWTTNPNRMLQLRARAFALRDQFPDALKGVGIREEVQDYQPVKRANAREVASDIVLPDEEPVIEAKPALPAKIHDVSQAAALEDTQTADLFEEVLK